MTTPDRIEICIYVLKWAAMVLVGVFAVELLACLCRTSARRESSALRNRVRRGDWYE